MTRGATTPLAGTTGTLAQVLAALVMQLGLLVAPVEVEIARADDSADTEARRPSAANVVPARVPILVAGAIWGEIVARPPTPDAWTEDCESHVRRFSGIVAAAVESFESHDTLTPMLAQQAALRRIATLVATGAQPDRLFDAIAEETSAVLGLSAISLVSYQADGDVFTHVAATAMGQETLPIGATWNSADSMICAQMLQTGRPARINDATDAPGLIAQLHRAAGRSQVVGAPIVVDGEPWGFIVGYCNLGEVIPDDSEIRLTDFTQLLATAISNSTARDGLRRLAESQSALRRVATLVAQDAEPRTVFVAVAEEAARTLGVGAVSLIRWNSTTRLYTKIYGTHGERAAVPDGGSWPVEDCPEGALILETGGAVRVDDWSVAPGPVAARHRADGFGQAVAAPIFLEGALWGHIAAFGEADDVLPAGSEKRLADFTQLMASAIANAEARETLRNLAREQGAALRRVATLVAANVEPATIFSAVAAEAARALHVETVVVGRCREDGGLEMVGLFGFDEGNEQGRAQSLEQCAVAVCSLVESRHGSARIDNWSVDSALRKAAEAHGIRSGVGAPILDQDQMWGLIVVLSTSSLPEDAETRLTDFTHLVSSSLANVKVRNDLIASRARVVAASDDTRRRIERNLHDGVQQRLIGISLGLRTLQVEGGLSPDLQIAVENVSTDIDSVLEEVRIFSQGLHPALLSRAGLGPSLRTLARRSPIAVVSHFDDVPRLHETLESTIYYTVSEALANASKHSQANRIDLSVQVASTEVVTAIEDNGIGGALIGEGSGLIGLVDRAEALGGRLSLTSPTGHGTRIELCVPRRPTPASHTLRS